MTGWQILGEALLVLPLVGVTVVGVKLLGWRAMAIIWGVTLVAAAIAITGSLLVKGEIP